MSPRIPTGRLAQVIGVMALMFSFSATADADFYLIFKSCKLAIAPLTPIDGGVDISDGELPMYACRRDGKLLACSMEFQGKAAGSTRKSVVYPIQLDSPPVLAFGSENGNETIMIHTVNRVVSLVTHAADISYFGAKVCRGIYATSIELEKLIEQAPKE